MCFSFVTISFSRMMKGAFVFLLFMTCTLASAAADPNLLFSVDFDDFLTKASFAKGSSESVGFPDADLQLRMYQGAKSKSNALCLSNLEHCDWNLPGNFSTQQGSVELWISPVDWTPAESKKRIIFFEAEQKDFRLCIQKGEGLEYISANLILRGKTVCILHAKIDHSQWTKKSWHQIFFVWNKNTAKLYVDGKLPKRHTPTGRNHALPDKTFHNPIQLPENAPKGKIIIGNKRVRKEISGTTAFDSLKIYSRCLTEAEIAENYEKVFPRKKKNTEPFLMTIPKVSSGIELDGELKTQEWADATGLPLLTAFEIADHKWQSDTRLYLKHDGKFVYMGFRTDRPCTVFKRTKHDSDIYNDDIFEFHTLDSAGKDIWLCVNSNSAIYDARALDAKWQSGAKAAAKRLEKGWSVELKIPMEAFDNPKPGERREANFWGLCFKDAPHYYHCWYSSPHARSGSGEGYIIFGEDETFTAFDTKQSIFNGTLDMEVRSSGTPVEVKCGTVAEKVSGKAAIAAKLQPGNQHLSIRQKDKNGKLSFVYEYDFLVIQPMQISYKAFPLRKTLEVNIDLNGAGAEILAAAEQGKVSGIVELRTLDGKVIEQAKCRLGSITQVNLPLSEELPAGKYEVHGRLEDNSLSSGTIMRVPERTPYKLKLADDREVPDPWHPLVYHKDGSFGVLDRVYRFEKSPFPSGIVSRGAELVAKPFRLVCNGKDVEWDTLTVSEKNPDYAVITGQGRCGELSFPWKGELWYDGFYKLDLGMTPEKKAKIDTLRLTFSIPAKYGKYFICRNEDPQIRGLVTMPWKDNRITGELNVIDAHWLTGNEIGFLWQPLDSANWVVGKEPVFSMSRNEDTVDVVLNMIGKTSELSRAANYSMAFMGTPARRPPEGIREFNYRGYLQPSYQNHESCGYNERNPGVMYGYSTHIFARPEHLRSTWLKTYTEKRGVKLIPYELPAALCEYDDEYDFWLPTWRRTPGYSLAQKGHGLDYTCVQCCSPGLADLFAYRTDKLFKEFPEMAGLYYDCCRVQPCDNVEHGHGGTDAFGQKINSTNALNLREYLMRIYKVLHRHGKILINHFHNYFNPVAHNFSDYYFPGENDTWMLGSNPEWFYCEVPPEEYEAAWSTVIRGTGIMRCTQILRAPMYVKSVRDMFNAHPEMIKEISIRSFTPCWIYDYNTNADYLDRQEANKVWAIRDKLKFNSAVFHGYWHDGNKVTTSVPGNRVSWYELDPSCGYSRLIAIGNFTRKEQSSGVTLNCGDLRLPQGKLQLVNMVTGQTVDADALSSVVIPANYCLLVAIKAQ